MTFSCTASGAAFRAIGAGVLLLAVLSGHARAEGLFACHAWPTQTCHVALMKDGAAVQRFTLRNGERRRLGEASAGQTYMMSINFDPPDREAAYSRSPHPEAKRSSWCMTGVLTTDADP